MQQQSPAGIDQSRLQEHHDVLAVLLLAVRAVGRAPHPFSKSVAEHVWVCPDDILPDGYSLLWAPCPEECTVPSPRGILQVFGLASFTPEHDKMSVQMSSAWSFPALHRTLSTELKACPAQAAYWESSSQHQTCSQSGVSSRELHEPRLLVSNYILIPHGTYFFPPPD